MARCGHPAQERLLPRALIEFVVLVKNSGQPFEYFERRIRYASGMRTEQAPDGYKHYDECFVCSREYQVGPHRFAGRIVQAWRIKLCERCEAVNHDGIVLEQHPRLLKHLTDAGIAITLNERGWLPIPRS